MGHDEPPQISLAAETDPAALEREQATRELGWETREMAANLLRVMRGAGRPSELPQQIINLAGAILETSKSARTWAVWSAIEDTLHSGVPNYWESPTSVRYESAIVKGALQLAASKLVFQNAQEAAGGRQIAEGIDDLERRRKEERRKWAAEVAAIRRDISAKRKKKVQKRPTVARPKAEARQLAVAEQEQRPSSTADFMKARKRKLLGKD